MEDMIKKEIDKENKAEKSRRATRAEIEGLEMRLLNIATITNNTNIPESDRLNLVYEIATGQTLEKMIRLAGMKALGLSAGEQSGGQL